MRADDPGRADGFPAFTVSVCAFGATRPDLAPYGEDLWGFGIVGEPLAPANCDTAPSPVELDPDAPDEPVTVTVGGLLHGYFGRSDCRVDECFVVIRQWAVDGYGGDGLLGHDVAIAAALLPFDAATAVPPPPSITIR